MNIDAKIDNGEKNHSKTEEDEKRYHTIMEKDKTLDPIASTPTNNVTRKPTPNENRESNTKDTNKESKNGGRGVKQGIPSLDVLEVQHECFGKAWGQLTPKLYTSPDSKCIKCIECCK